MQPIGLGDMPVDVAQVLRQLPHLLHSAVDLARSASGSIHVRVTRPALTRAELLTLAECPLLSRLEPVGAGGFKLVFHRDHIAATNEMMALAVRAREDLLMVRTMLGEADQVT